MSILDLRFRYIYDYISVLMSYENHGRTGRGGGGGGRQPPKFVGQTKPVGQYSLNSRAILAYYKNKWDKFCQFCGKFCQFCGKYAI